MKGKINQITKNKSPKIRTKKKNIIPTRIVKNRTIKPRPREIELKVMYSKSFLKSRPRGLRVISRFQGANNVFKSKGIEK